MVVASRADPAGSRRPLVPLAFLHLMQARGTVRTPTSTSALSRSLRGFLRPFPSQVTYRKLRERMTIPRHLRTVWMLLVPLSWIAATSVHAQRRDDSPWSVSPSAALSLDPASWVQDMIAAGVRSVRGFSRPEPIAAAGLGLTGILTVPNAQARQTFPIDDLPGYRRYVTREVTRYKGIVRYWEVWNEPPNFSEDQSPASYARIVAAAYDAAKAVDPTVQIGLSAKSVHLGFMAEALDAGARGKYDYITLHPYETASLLQDNWEGPFLGIVPTLRTMLKDKDPARAKVPVWFTEIGVEVAEQGRQGVSLAEQADLLVKIYAMSLAQGVTRVSWFAPRDSEGTTHGLSWANGERKPAFNAYETITQSLGTRLVLGERRAQAGVQRVRDYHSVTRACTPVCRCGGCRS